MSEEKTIHFIGGMPRAGSTLLCNILAQNPRFHATGTSGIIGVLIDVRNSWHNRLEFRSMPEAETEAAKMDVLRGILQGYFKRVDKPVIFDRSRGWPGFMELGEAILGRKPKILVPVRDMRDILASFEKLFRKTSATRQTSQEATKFFENRTVAGRCQFLCNNDQIVGSAYINVKDAIARGWREYMYFVDYERLTMTPGPVLKEIYAYLEETPFEHDFNNVQQVTQEDDLVWLFKDLHTIRPKVEANLSEWKKILGKKVGATYKKDKQTGEEIARFWEEDSDDEEDEDNGARRIRRLIKEGKPK